MTLVYDNTTSEQAIFTYAFSGQNLNNNIVFTVKKLVSNFKLDFPLLFKNDYKDEGRPKEYYSDELLEFYVYGIYNNRFSSRNWLIGLITMMDLLIISCIHRFLQENTLLVNAFFHYTVILGINLGLIDGECITVDGTIVKVNSNNFRVIKLMKLNFCKI